MFLTKIVGKRFSKQVARRLGRKPVLGARTIMGAKVLAGAFALAGAAVPIVMALRKRMGIHAARTKLAEAKEAARKIPHAAKPRKARRIARHLAKTLGPAAGTA
jgi:hypothetical protein